MTKYKQQKLTGLLLTTKTNEQCVGAEGPLKLKEITIKN